MVAIMRALVPEDLHRNGRAAMSSLTRAALATAAAAALMSSCSGPGPTTGSLAC
jgi:hypothetical protein